MAEYFHATVVLKEQCQLYNSDELSEESLFNKKVYMVKDRSLQNKQCYCQREAVWSKYTVFGIFLLKWQMQKKYIKKCMFFVSHWKHANVFFFFFDVFKTLKHQQGNDSKGISYVTTYFEHSIYILKKVSFHKQNLVA